MSTDKISRRKTGLSAVQTQLFRRGYLAVLQGRNTPNTDIICSNRQKTKSVNIIVRTFNPERRTCIIGPKAAQFFGDNYFWILSGIPLRDSSDEPEFFIIPNRVMAENEPKYYQKWLDTPGEKGQPHADNSARVILLPPTRSPDEWDISFYLDKWVLIDEMLK